LRELRRAQLRAGDHVKLRIELTEAEKHDWSRIRREAVNLLKESKIVISGVELLVIKANRHIIVSKGGHLQKADPIESVTRFVEREELGGEALDAALAILNNRRKS